MRGRMRYDVYVSCGCCQNHEFVDTGIHSAVKQAKLDGWVYTKKDGWVCPKCNNPKTEREEQNDALNDALRYV